MVPECTTEKIANQGVVNPVAFADGSCPDSPGSEYICTIPQTTTSGGTTTNIKRCYRAGAQDAAEVKAAIDKTAAAGAAAAAAAGAPAAGAPAPAKIVGFAYGVACSTKTGEAVPPGTIGNPTAGWDGFMTAIGCVPSKPDALVNSLIKYSSFAAGGIAFLLMLLASLQMITAEGNPESIKKAQEKFYSAIIGLLLIIFSVLLMQVIGVDILGLPGFGKQ